METLDILLTDKEIDQLLQDTGAVESLGDLMKLSFVIKKLRQEIDRVREAQQAAMRLYRERIERLEASIEFLQGKLIPALKRHGKLPLPDGTTAFVQERKTVVYDMDELELARKYGYVRVKEEPDRKALSKAILEGEIQEGAHVETKDVLVIR